MKCLLKSPLMQSNRPASDPVITTCCRGNMCTPKSHYWKIVVIQKAVVSFLQMFFSSYAETKTVVLQALFQNELKEGGERL